MSLINSTAIPSGVATGYQIANSARFNGTSTKLTRTPSSTGNRRMLTFSAWIKQGDVSTSINGNAFFSAGVNGDKFAYQSGSLFRTTGYKSSAYWGMRDWNGVQRDSGGWKHIVMRFDTAQGTEANRSKLFINGVEATQNYKYYDIAQNYDMRYNHTADAHWLGAMNNGAYFDGYMAEVHWIDGAIVSPNAFGEVGDYGEWKPKAYVPADYAAYGTNGYYLNFADSSHFGKDVSGNGNNWTDTGFGTHDQMLDSPTNNFATPNPLNGNSSGYTFTEGNLYAKRSAGAWQPYYGTMGMPSGKWYWEAFYKVGYDAQIGVALDTYSSTTTLQAAGAYSIYSVANGTGYKYDNGSQSYGGGAWHWSTNVILQVAYDADTGKMWIGKDNTWYSSGNPSTGANPWVTVSAANRGNLLPAFAGYDSATQQYINFGQDSSFTGLKTAQNNQDANDIGDFYYTPPTGFLALCTSNLPDVAVVPSENFNTVLYTGTDATNSTHAITGVNFQPDWVWTKDRDAAYDHYIFDAVRGTGVTKGMRVSSIAAEGMANNAYDALSSFDSNGFTITGAGFGSLYQDRNNADYVSWNWKANGSGSANTTGSINTIKTSANVDAGFSIVKWVGNEGSDESIGHGLSKAPEMILTWNLDEGWGNQVYHKAMGTNKKMMISETSGAETDTDVWADTAPTSSVFYVGTDIMTNWDDRNYIGYCFHSVDGYSKVGSYVGNSSANGTFVYTGFKPAFVMVKNTDGWGWFMHDSAREPNNENDVFLLADSTAADSATDNSHMDFLSNGFKLRTSSVIGNGSSYTLIYIAFAETPFKYSNAN